MGRHYKRKPEYGQENNYDGRYDHLYGHYYGSMFDHYTKLTKYEPTYSVSWEPYTKHQIKIYLDDGTARIYNGRHKTIRNVLPNDHSEKAITRDFSYNLQERLYDKNMTQSELSKITHISQPMISNYINREKTPTLSAALRIADALDCSVYDLVES